MNGFLYRLKMAVVYMAMSLALVASVAIVAFMIYGISEVVG